MSRIVPWTESELETLRRLYPEHGSRATAEALPGRSAAAVNFKAWQLQVHTSRRGRPCVERSSTPVPRQAAQRRAAASQPSPRSEAPVAQAPAAAPATTAPKRNCEIVRAKDIAPGMIVNRYPAGTSAAPALREVREARFSEAGSRVFFNLSWLPSRDPKAKRETPSAFWDYYRNPELSFEVYPSFDAVRETATK